MKLTKEQRAFKLRKEKCPKCGERLRDSDVEGYTFVCFECDENFYRFETK